MTIGPLERFAQRLEQLEGAAWAATWGRGAAEGAQGGEAWGGRDLDQGEVGPEASRRVGQARADLVGEMILAYNGRNFGAAQKFLDALAYGFRLRMDVERANSATIATSSSACVDKDDAARD
jgi:hypothetical protein